MPNPSKTYGTPIGPQAAVQRDRPKAAPADPATIHAHLDAYEKRLLEEHQRIQQARKLVPRPPATPSPNANTRGGTSLKVEKALKDAGG